MASPHLAFLDLGFQELVVVMIVALLMYGGRLPEVARSLGRTVGEFKRSAQGLTREFRVDLDTPFPRRPSEDVVRRRLRNVEDDAREDEPPEEPAGPPAGESGKSEESEESDTMIGPRPAPTPFSAVDPLPETDDAPPAEEPPPGPPGTQPRQD